MNNYIRFSLNTEFILRLLFVLCATSLILAISDNAFASSSSSNPNDVVGLALCRLVSNLSGGIARGIATLAIFSTGVGLFLGKINWGLGATIAAGVGIIFAAPKLVAFLSGNADNANCPTS